MEKTIEDVREVFEKSPVSEDDCIKICLLLEEALLRCQQHFGQNYHYTLQIQKWFGVPKVIIRIKGEAYNPLSDGDIDDDDDILPAQVLKGLMNYEQAETIYTYRNGYNEISTYAGKAWKPFRERTVSKDPSSNGRAPTSPCRKVMFLIPAASAFFLAAFIISAE